MLQCAGMPKDFIASALAWAPITVLATPAAIGMRYPTPLPSSGVPANMLVDSLRDQAMANWPNTVLTMLKMPSVTHHFDCFVKCVFSSEME